MNVTPENVLQARAVILAAFQMRDHEMRHVLAGRSQ